MVMILEFQRFTNIQKDNAIIIDISQGCVYLKTVIPKMWQDRKDPKTLYKSSGSFAAEADNFLFNDIIGDAYMVEAGLAP